MGTSQATSTTTKRAAKKEIASADSHCAKRYPEQPVEQEKTV
jgi:hypothetical protein